jgi:hypothetical protein
MPRPIRRDSMNTVLARFIEYVFDVMDGRLLIMKKTGL